MLWICTLQHYAFLPRSNMLHISRVLHWFLLTFLAKIFHVILSRYLCTLYNNAYNSCWYLKHFHYQCDFVTHIYQKFRISILYSLFMPACVCNCTCCITWPFVAKCKFHARYLLDQHQVGVEKLRCNRFAVLNQPFYPLFIYV